jgi:hypothetical protein
MTVLLAVSLWRQEPSSASTAIREQIACAPKTLSAPPVDGIRVAGSAQHGRLMFAPGDAVIINAGRSQGVQAGQRYFVRRYIHDRFTPASLDFQPFSIHTTGWLTIVDVKDTMSVAQVTHACDGILEGDFLEPYVDPVEPPPALGGAPDFEHPGRIVMADERRQMGFEGLMMILNRGSDHAVRAGQTLTIYRETLNGQGPNIDVGRATVLVVGPQLSLIRIDSSREPVYLGDFAAIHRITQ